MNKIIVTAVCALAAGYIIGAFLGTSVTKFAGTTNLDTLALGTGLSVGSSGTTLSQIVSGTFTNTSCSGAATQGAFATTTYSCTATGATAGDRVFVQLSATTTHGVVLQTAYASTTANDNIRVVLYNASTTAGTATTTGASYFIVR